MNGIALYINKKDNVATVFMNDVKTGQYILVKDRSGETKEFKVNQPIPYGHKIAVKSIPVGTPVIKYGEQIGIATKDIQPGDHVHIFNLESTRGRGDLKL